MRVYNVKATAYYSETRYLETYLKEESAAKRVAELKALWHEWNDLSEDEKYEDNPKYEDVEGVTNNNFYYHWNNVIED